MDQVRFSALLTGAMLLGVVASNLLSKDRRHAWRSMAFFLAWFMPGLGHALMGKWRKALFFFAVLAVLYVFGLWITGWRMVDWHDNPFVYVGRFGSGITALLAILLGDVKSYPREDLPKSWYDSGLLYVCVAGLLNLVIMLNVLTIPVPAAPAEEPKGKPAEGAAAPPAPPVPEGGA